MNHLRFGGLSYLWKIAHNTLNYRQENNLRRKNPIEI